MLVSDERAKEIGKTAWTISLAASVDCINELLADRKERIQKEQAMIVVFREWKAKIGVDAEGKTDVACEDFEDYIRDPKEADDDRKG